MGPASISTTTMLTACSPEVATRPDAGVPFDTSRDAEAPLDANLNDVAEAGPAMIPNWLLTVENGGADNEIHRLLRVSVAPADYGMTPEKVRNAYRNYLDYFTEDKFLEA